MYQGDHWITGCGNHDTVRRGNQIERRSVQLTGIWAKLYQKFYIMPTIILP